MKSLSDALVSVTEQTYHYFAPPGTEAPYIVWAEDGRNDLIAGCVHAEKSWTGTVDLFTGSENDKKVIMVESALEFAGVAYSLVSVAYEEETGLIHYSWDWENPDGND